MYGFSVALADDETVTVQDILAVTAVNPVKKYSDVLQLSLFLCDRHSFEDAVVTAAYSVFLVIRKVSVLQHFYIIYDKVPGDTANRRFHIFRREMYRCLRNDMAHAVTEQDFHGNPRVFFLPVCQINESARNSVRHFVRVGGVYFFKHIDIPFRERSRRSITSSCGVAPINSAEQFSLTIWKI